MFLSLTLKVVSVAAAAVRLLEASIQIGQAVRMAAAKLASGMLVWAWVLVAKSQHTKKDRSNLVFISEKGGIS